MKLINLVNDILEEQMASVYGQSKLPFNQYKMKSDYTGQNFQRGLGPLRYSDNAINLIKKYESFANKSYLCPSGKKTIGYGTRIDYHPEIKKGTCITEKKAIELLRKDLDTLVTPVIKKNIKVKLKQNQIDALYSLIHNIGVNNFVNSNVLKLLNRRRFTRMKKDWQEFQMGGGRVLPGLQKRRQDELRLFFS